MKLINYNYGYSNIFNCSIHGKIIVSQKEWKYIVKYLNNPAVKYGYKFVLRGDLERYVETKRGRLFNIRVSATGLVVNKFNVKGYKQGNYTFLVTK